jgi:hypothetical protein
VQEACPKEIPIDFIAYMNRDYVKAKLKNRIAHLLGAAPEPWEWDRFAMGHASVAVLATTPMAGHHIWSLRALGDANHLPLDDRTA